MRRVQKNNGRVFKKCSLKILFIKGKKYLGGIAGYHNLIQGEDPKITMNARNLVSFTGLCKSSRFFSQRGISPQCGLRTKCVLAPPAAVPSLPTAVAGYEMLVWPSPSAGPREGVMSCDPEGGDPMRWLPHHGHLAQVTLMLTALQCQEAALLCLSPFCLASLTGYHPFYTPRNVKHLFVCLGK